VVDITLHRAGRILEAIRAGVGGIELAQTAKVSIFGEPVAELGQKAAALSADIDKLEAMLGAQARIRAIVGRANAELGIGDLLAEKSAAEEWLKLVGPFVNKGPSKLAGIDVVLRRHRADAANPADVEALAAAKRERYAASDAEVDASIETRVMDDDMTAALAKRAAQRRRDVERISDRLRELNARTITLADADIDALTAQDVI